MFPSFATGGFPIQNDLLHVLQAASICPAMKYLVTIGLEVHVQLKTQSKMFCSCANEFGATPNTHTCPVCLGMPGALPVMNEEALRLITLTGLMLGCRIAPVCKFDRKNYFYPDMPKNYQISQYDMPICEAGTVPLHDLAYPKDAQKNIASPGKAVRLVRIHLEEDVAKSFHLETSTGIDFNRAGTPLMEIVTEPDIDSPDQAFAFLSSLKQILIYGDVSDADMEKGQLRCDCNISVRPEGQKEFGTKIEIKNMNSISGVRRALSFEIERQIEILTNGGTLQQETRRWNDTTGETDLMRIKESAHDYRYFPEPDLLPVQTDGLVEAAAKRRPELPAEKRARFVSAYEVSDYDAAVLADDLDLASYFEKTVSVGGPNRKAKTVANWVINDLLSALGNASVPVSDCPIPPEALDSLLALIDEGKINGKQAKEVFTEMFQSGKAAAVIVKEKGLEQVSDSGAIESLVDQVIAANPKPVEDYRSGNKASINFLKGQVMKLSKGQANPALVGEVLVQKLG